MTGSVESRAQWHAGQARSILDQVGRIASTRPGIENDAAALCALTHAVLAVAEQLRINNAE